jgi:hypothetical protein
LRVDAEDLKRDVGVANLAAELEEEVADIEEHSTMLVVLGYRSIFHVLGIEPPIARI